MTFLMTSNYQKLIFTPYLYFLSISYISNLIYILQLFQKFNLFEVRLSNHNTPKGQLFFLRRGLLTFNLKFFGKKNFFKRFFKKKLKHPSFKKSANLNLLNFSGYNHLLSYRQLFKFNTLDLFTPYIRYNSKQIFNWTLTTPLFSFLKKKKPFKFSRYNLNHKFLLKYKGLKYSLEFLRRRVLVKSLADLDESFLDKSNITKFFKFKYKILTSRTFFQKKLLTKNRRNHLKGGQLSFLNFRRGIVSNYPLYKPFKSRIIRLYRRNHKKRFRKSQLKDLKSINKKVTSWLSLKLKLLLLTKKSKFFNKSLFKRLVCKSFRLKTTFKFFLKKIKKSKRWSLSDFRVTTRKHLKKNFKKIINKKIKKTKVQSVWKPKKSLKINLFFKRKLRFFWRKKTKNSFKYLQSIYLYYTNVYRHSNRLKSKRFKMTNKKINYFRRLRFFRFKSKFIFKKTFIRRFLNKKNSKRYNRSKKFLEKFVQRFNDDFLATLPKSEKKRHKALKQVFYSSVYWRRKRRRITRKRFFLKNSFIKSPIFFKKDFRIFKKVLLSNLKGPIKLPLRELSALKLSSLNITFSQKRGSKKTNLNKKPINIIRFDTKRLLTTLLRNFYKLNSNLIFSKNNLNYETSLLNNSYLIKPFLNKRPFSKKKKLRRLKRVFYKKKFYKHKALLIFLTLKKKFFGKKKNFLEKKINSNLNHYAQHFFKKKFLKKPKTFFKKLRYKHYLKFRFLKSMFFLNKSNFLLNFFKDFINNSLPSRSPFLIPDIFINNFTYPQNNSLIFYTSVYNLLTYIKHKVNLNFNKKSSSLFIKTLHKRSFILSNIGFMILTLNYIKLSTKYFYKKSQMKSKIYKNQLSFFYKNDLKRIYLRRPGFVKALLLFSKKRKKPNTKYTNSYWSFSTFNQILTNPTSRNPYLLNRFFKKSIAKYRSKGFFIAYNKAAPFKQVYPMRRIRFKPGYQRIWRRARASLNFNLKFNFRYQGKLTRKVTFLRRLKNLYAIWHVELSLHKIILNARFVFDHKTSYELINSGLVYLNGILSLNPNMRLFESDFLQLLVSIKYYISYRWLNNWRRFNKTKLIKLINHKRNSSKYDLSKQVSKHLPDWVFNYIFKNLDIPKYLEVDFFTLSLFLIFQPTKVNQVNPLSLIETRHSIYTMYNWKYIN